ncbi:MAG TPA: metallophosphoesterase [Gemmatimonadales bacterium]|nr:metallophosphoesterase [Gemmatimonadales bacterium]
MSRFPILVLLLGLSGCLGSAPPPIPLNPVRFLLVNDVSVADTTASGRGGLARVATVRSRLADQGPILFVLAGDVLSPSGPGKYYNGRQMIQAFNAAKLDYATFGDHDFDVEIDTLVARIAESRFKWISSNCTLAGGAPIAKVLPWDTLHISGHKVGLFGLTLQGNYRPEIRCTDPDSAAVRVVEALTAEGADLIVGLTHQSVRADRDLLVREPRIDLILGGHEQEALDSTVSGRHLVKADANAESAQFVTLWGGKGNWRQAVGLVPIDAALPPDTTVARVVREWNDSLEKRLGPERTVGRSALPIQRLRAK